jgi:uncharacterized membrane protein
MHDWSIDIIRQSGWDLWVWLCLAAAAVLLSYALLARVWSTGRRGIVSLVMIAVGVGGTILVVALPALHVAKVGLVWTFTLLSLLSATFYLNLRQQLSVTRTGMLLCMRIVALALLVPMLFEPVLRFVSRPKPERPLLVLVDTSGSMSFPDVQNGPTRLQSVWQALRPLLPRIDEHFIPCYFTFDSSARDLKGSQQLAALQADGKSTDVVGGVSHALAGVARDDAAVLLISDGIDNTSPNVTAAVRSAAGAHAVHTVRVGSDQAEPATMANIAVDNVESPDDFVVNHESTLKATVRSTALANRVVDVQLSEIDSGGKSIGLLTSRRLVLQPTPEGQTVELPFKPPSVGVHKLAVWIDPVPGERSTIDNRQELQILAIDPRIKVIYIEGRARPEYRELSRALARDSNIELATLLRIQQDRFAASGTVDGDAFKQMPASSAEWGKFDVIILGDLDSSFIGRPQQQLIEQRTSAGAGLLMIGGQNSFGPGGYKDSPIEKALPVFVGDTNAAQEKSQFVPQMTPEGAGHPAMEGLAEWFSQSSSTTTSPAKTLPPLRGNVVVAGAKSGAQILLVHPGALGPDGKPQIVLASQMYGTGRSAAFTADTTYLWYLPLRAMGQDSPYNRLWGQLVRWLAGQDVRNRQRGAGLVALLNKSNFQLGENVKVRAMVRDERGDATRYAQVTLTLTNTTEKKPQTFALSPAESRTGMYELTLPNPAKGDYDAELVAKKDGHELGREKLHFTVIPPADEMLKIAANPKLLADIADATHGFHYELGQLPTLIDELIRLDPQSGQPQQRSIALSNVLRASVALGRGSDLTWPARYDLPMQGLLVLALLLAEWLLRRRWQLP